MSKESSSAIRFAMVGCGRMGRHHSEKLRQDGRGEVVALFDAHEPSADRLRRDLWPSAVVSTTFENLLERGDVDAAVICTPTAEHYSHATASLNRGWHLLCEKPLASDRTQILSLLAMSDVCRAKGQAFSLAYQRRYTSLYRTLRREIRSGRWGAVRAITSHNVEHWQPTIGGTWRDDPNQNPGGFVTDAGSHKLDALFYVTGLTPRQVFARSQKWGSDVEIVTSLSALLSNDVTVTMDFIGHAQYLGEDLHIHCEKADVMLRHEELWIAREGRRERLAADEPDSNPIVGFLNMILKQEPDLSPPEAALPVYDMTQAILSSSRSGHPAILEP